MIASGRQGRRVRRLAVYVKRGCFACQHALEVAQRAARAFPGLRVDIVTISEDGQLAPPEVVGVPAFVLDGRVVSLGTPDWARLVAAVTASTSGSDH